MVEPFCSACCGHHEPDPPETTVVVGLRWVFTPPFRCICCGVEICARQFAWGLMCGPCDIGACRPDNRAYRDDCAHKRPDWWRPFRSEMLDAFAGAVGAQRPD